MLLDILVLMHFHLFLQIKNIIQYRILAKVKYKKKLILGISGILLVIIKIILFLYFDQNP
jgi:hypothetical protein